MTFFLLCFCKYGHGEWYFTCGGRAVAIGELWWYGDFVYYDDFGVVNGYFLSNAQALEMIFIKVLA